MARQENASYEGQGQRTPVDIKNLLIRVDELERKLDEVNSNLENCYSLSGGILIPDNADLYSDTYKVPGNYYCPSNVNAVTLKNCPLSKAFILKVDYTNGTQYIRQSFVQYNIEQNYQRIWNPPSNVWEHDLSLLTNLEVQRGSTPGISCAANAITESTITFPKAFKSAPKVVVGFYSDTKLAAYGMMTPMVCNVTTTNFKARIANASDTALTPAIYWIARE